MFVTANKDALKRQQLIMKTLGYYTGKLDGIWSKDSIAAMRAWENSGKFKPAFPSQGLPLDPFSKLPRGVYRDPSNRGFLTMDNLDLTQLDASNSEIKTSTTATSSVEDDTETGATEIKEAVENSSSDTSNFHKKKKRRH